MVMHGKRAGNANARHNSASEMSASAVLDVVCDIRAIASGPWTIAGQQCRALLETSWVTIARVERQT